MVNWMPDRKCGIPLAFAVLPHTFALLLIRPTMTRLFPSLIVFLVAVFVSTGISAAAPGPDEIVANLYKADTAGSGPFFQTKNRAIVDQYFQKDLANLIWKDALSAKGDIGALDYNPLYASQDPQITDFKILKSVRTADDKASVKVTFKDSGKKASVTFLFAQDKAGVWKISDITYPDGSSLRKTVDGTAMREAVGKD